MLQGDELRGLNNQKRRARKLVKILNANYEHGQHAQNVRDMIADLCHFCDIKGIDFYAESTMGYEHYRAEKHGED